MTYRSLKNTIRIATGQRPLTPMESLMEELFPTRQPTKEELVAMLLKESLGILANAIARKIIK